MKNWWPSIFIFLFFCFAGFQIWQANSINDVIIRHYLSGKGSSNFKSDLPEINYFESLQFISNSVDLNAKLMLNKKDSIYNFQFTPLFNPEKKWNLIMEKSGEHLILKEIKGIENYKEIIHCK